MSEGAIIEGVTRELDQSKLYYSTNVPTLMPLLAAILVLVVVRLLSVLPSTCPLPNQSTISPVFCGQGKAVESLFESRPSPLQTTGPEADKYRSAMFREARWRVAWISAFGVEVAATLVTFMAMIWIWGLSIEDHLVPEPLKHLSEGYRRKTDLAILILLTGMLSVVAYLGAYAILHYVVFNKMPAPGPIDSAGILEFSDNVESTALKSLSDYQVTQRISLLVFLTVAVIAGAVTATLYQQPEQVSERRGLDQAPSLPGRAERFLARCFQRLTTCIYFGATLLIVCGFQLNTRYQWMATLLASDDPALAKAFSDWGAQMAAQYGFVFTLLLGALFAPTYVILRRRAWELARTRKPDGQASDHAAFLAGHNLTLTNWQQYSQVIAILAPAGLGSIPAFLQIFGAK